MSVYPPLIEEQMRSFYESLSEKDRRRYAAVEAAQRGRGGLTCISEVLGCKRHTITQGLRDLQDPDARSQTRIRRKGGGGKPNDYPEATSILMRCDRGGRNGGRRVLFKVALQRFAEEIGWVIRVAHFPPYTSKYNPIDHRLFPPGHRVCQGVLFTGIKRVKELRAKATTKTGLRGRVHLLNKVYQTGRKVTREIKEQMRILFDADLPEWNYPLLPAE